MKYVFTVCGLLVWTIHICNATIPLPSFQDLIANYPGYKHHSGHFRNHAVIKMIGCQKEHLLHDTSALRLSYAFNKIGGEHSLGKALIRLSKFGEDSVAGKDGTQYLYHPIAYGPFLADKYGYPSVSKLHQTDPINTKRNFYGKQGILRVITYTDHSNLPKGHVALWDCNHFHQSKDWIVGHNLITIEFWQSPDSNCSGMLNKTQSTASMHVLHPSTRSFTLHSTAAPKTKIIKSATINSDTLPQTVKTVNFANLLHNKSYRRKFLKQYFVSNGHLRHAKHRGMTSH